VACRIKVLGYMEDLRSTYIFAEFLYLYQLTLHPSPNTPLISTRNTQKKKGVVWSCTAYRVFRRFGREGAFGGLTKRWILAIF
jgi:hypothetical protein